MSLSQIRKSYGCTAMKRLAPCRCAIVAVPIQRVEFPQQTGRNPATPSVRHY